MHFCILYIAIVSAASALQVSLNRKHHTITHYREATKTTSHLFQVNNEKDQNNPNATFSLKSSTLGQSFDSIVMDRYACTRFHRHEEQDHATAEFSASKSNHENVNKAIHCLDIARRAPSGFNVQPYKFIVVHTPSKKEQVAKYCLGRNADRVRDSDCTVLFLADRESARDWKRFSSFLKKSISTRKSGKDAISKWVVRKIQILTLLFSSGWPLPRIIAAPLSFGIRFGVSVVSALTRRRVLVPSLSSSETWSSKNTMLVAMTYLLGCTSRELTTCPMEGFNAGGIRKVLGIPRRYSIPLIVSTGIPYVGEEEGKDDVGLVHGSCDDKNELTTKRYRFEEVVFSDESFGKAMNYRPLDEKIVN